VKLLSLIHRWAGGLIGLLLAALGLTGAILVWEGDWVRIAGASDPLIEQPSAIAAIVEREAASASMSRITFANDEIGLHQLVNRDGSGAYIGQDGAVVEQWASQWERPELWLFDLHHHLFAGETGETVTGIAGIAGLAFVVTGLILWWRARRSFRPTLFPKTMAPGPIVRHHRDLGIVTSPLLLLSLGTGVLMLFEPVRTTMLGGEQRPERVIAAQPLTGAGDAVIRAKALYPDARLRRLTLPSEPGGAISVRLRQPFEWTPNGRTQVTFAADGTVTIQDAAAANGAAMGSEKLYPIHSAKVGGMVTKLLMTVSGVALAMLGSLAVYSFWFRQAKRRRRKQAGKALETIAGNVTAS